MSMEHARHKDKGKGFGITQGRGRASYRSGVNLLFMASTSMCSGLNANILCFQAGNNENAEK